MLIPGTDGAGVLDVETEDIEPGLVKAEWVAAEISETLERVLGRRDQCRYIASLQYVCATIFTLGH